MTKKTIKTDQNLASIQKTIKILMRNSGHTHESLAKELNVSPATIKRRLNGQSTTIQQIGEFSNLLGYSFHELVDLSAAESNKTSLFTEEQERLLAKDLKYMLVFRYILLKKSFEEILHYLSLKESQLREILRHLEEVNLTELHKNDRLKTKIKFPFQWKSNGPLHQKYYSFLIESIFKQALSNSNTSGLNCKFEILLTPKHYAEFCDEVKSVYLKYRGISKVLLETEIKEKKLVAGIFFIDNFSPWGKF